MSNFRAAVLLTAAIAVFIVTIGVTNKALAAEVEHETITTSWESFLNADTPTPEDVQPYLDDILELVDDTTAGSYCEQYASAAAVIIGTFQRVVALDEYESQTYSEYVTAVNVIYPELDRLATACLNEE